MRAADWGAPMAEGEAILGGMRAARRDTVGAKGEGEGERGRVSGL